MNKTINKSMNIISIVMIFTIFINFYMFYNAFNVRRESYVYDSDFWSDMLTFLTVLSFQLALILLFQQLKWLEEKLS
jgi:hypothetical protein